MYLRKSVFTLLLILCNVFVVVAQTTADSLALVTASLECNFYGKRCTLSRSGVRFFV